MITLGVREFYGSSDGRRRFCGNKSEKFRSLSKEARQNSPSGSSQVQEFTGSPPEHRREFIGYLPEAHRKKRLAHRNTSYSINVYHPLK